MIFLFFYFSPLAQSSCFQTLTVGHLFRMSMCTVKHIFIRTRLRCISIMAPERHIWLFIKQLLAHIWAFVKHSFWPLFQAAPLVNLCLYPQYCSGVMIVPLRTMLWTADSRRERCWVDHTIVSITGGVGKKEQQKKIYRQQPKNLNLNLAFGSVSLATIAVIWPCD